MAASWCPTIRRTRRRLVTYQPAEEGFASVENLGEERARLFVKNRRAYHRAFAETGSASGDCALRYPDYLTDKNLPGVLGSALRQANFSSSTCRCA